jgi:CspA family cold shock protein
MATGTVKWFNASKHYGFIAPDQGDREVFVHRSALTTVDGESLNDGARVSFDLAPDADRPSAVNVAVLGTSPSE